MTATLTRLACRPAADVAVVRLGFAGVLRSEWIKLWTLRSTIWSFTMTVAIAWGLSLLTALTLAAGTQGPIQVEVTTNDAMGAVVGASLFGVYLGQLVVGVLGVLTISSEYSTGMIRATLAAVPRRSAVLGAKAMVLFAATVVVGILANVGGHLIAAGVLGVPVGLTDPGVQRLLVGGAGYLGLVALLSLAIGTMLRSSAGGIAAVLGLLFLLPTVLGSIPVEWARQLSSYLFTSAGLTLLAGPEPGAGSTLPFSGQGALVALAWVVAASAGAAAVFHRRDA